MNYRHAFHAGSFADVHKHAVLCRILQHLRDKPAGFRVIDSHAGAGVYDLASPKARRSGEWHDGIEHLMTAALPAPVAELLAPYLEVIGALNERGRLTSYPGSPALARAALRAQDPLIACELEPQAAAALARNLAAIRVSRRCASKAGPRLQPLCRRKSGAAWCWSIRRSKRSANSPG